ncbi:putative outer membrane starch-binding protein [Chitinophaga japonensis]|uniref:Putative outer membrane starch-binding protein n=2 Tax=Chitinophaga japonensis TaxID=104662 RepID=A0A562T4S2_CHIJA|nr:putative outer membrane starch-binding protein [Chitinophaga japonensis]
MQHNKIVIAAALLLAALAGCKKDFLEEKRDLGGVNEEVFQDSTLAQAYVDYVYGLFLPGSKSESMTWNLATNNSQFTQTTEELAGQTNWNREWAAISYLNGHALGYFGEALPTSIRNNTWTRLKQINLFFDNIDNYGLPLYTRRKLKGQLFFWRAWQYFDLVRLYGGVPLVLHAQDPVLSGGESLEIPRSTSSACIEQIVSDLDSAMAMLPGRWPSGGDWGRITAGAAAALKGRVLLTWASPLFNRADDRARWKRAYDANAAAKALLEANGFGLYKTGDLANATAWENMFTTEVDNPEAVIVFGFNNVISDQVQKWNGWENDARPKEIFGGGSLSPTKQMLDAFPMKDGKMPGASNYTYDPLKFYKNRDPRFYKTFAYNGALWPYRENPQYRLWTYRWFNKDADATPGNTTEQRGANSSGIYVRKATAANASIANGDFETSGTDYMEMRFAEVLLNLAESAVGNDNIGEGLEYVKAIRERAGVENADGAYGLSGIAGRDEAFAAVLNERKIELAYEGKRFWDLRRWMLFNNDYGTCSRLGVQPLNGMRRTGIYIYVKTTEGTKYSGGKDKDPLYKVQYTNPDGTIIAPREPETFPPGINNQDEYVDFLYDNYFVIMEKDDLDPTNNDWKFTWYNAYYFFGLNQTALNNAPYLEQTQGWDGLTGAGSFDPLK